MGLGHVRYPTAGTASVQEAQPFFVNSPLGMYLVHNGNITNTAELKVLLNSSSSFFNRYLRTDSDSEVCSAIFAVKVWVHLCCISLLFVSCQRKQPGLLHGCACEPVTVLLQLIPDSCWFF